MAEIHQVDTKFINFLFKGITHGIKSIKKGNDSLTPFVMTSLNEEKQLLTFEAITYEERMICASEFIKNMDPVPDYALLVYDGIMAYNGENYNAIMVQAHDKSLDESFVFGQRYLLKRDNHEFRTIKNTAYIGKEINYLNESESNKKSSCSDNH